MTMESRWISPPNDAFERRPLSTGPDARPLFHASSHLVREEEDSSLLGARKPSQIGIGIATSSFRGEHGSYERRSSEGLHGLDNEDEKSILSKTKRKMYWITPTAATALFLTGLAAAICHCVYFSVINETRVGDQTWTLRYSLALAFIFKSSLAASVSIALAQYVWYTLRQSQKGTAIVAIDAMFQSGSSLLSFISPSLWRSAVGTALVASCIWLLPLTAIVAPTSLTVGTSVLTSTQDCSVRTVNWGVNRTAEWLTNARALYVTDYESLSPIKPSPNSQRLTAAVLETGSQAGWQSPCGANCTYNVQFTAPSWRCFQSDDVDDKRAPWRRDGSWYGGDPDQIVHGSFTLYGSVYAAGLNASTNQFWISFATGYARDLEPATGLSGTTLRHVLDVQAYFCHVVQTSYSVQVTYRNGLQTTTLQNAEPLSTVQINKEEWNRAPRYLINGSTHFVPQHILDVVGMYTPMISMLSGTIVHDPRETLIMATSIGLIPSLISNLPKAATSYYGQGTPYLPRRDLGPLLEELSHNLTVSLMSDTTLLVTDHTTVACHRHHTETVWKVNWLPILAAYSTGLAVVLVCLILGAYALVVNGVAHDTSFSSVMRTTRNDGLDQLVAHNDTGALPLLDRVSTQKLKFLSECRNGLSDEGATRTRNGFTLAD